MDRVRLVTDNIEIPSDLVKMDEIDKEFQWLGIQKFPVATEEDLRNYYRRGEKCKG